MPRISDLDSARQELAHALSRLLFAIGEDVDREDLKQTPTRATEALLGFLTGVRVDPGYALGEKLRSESEDLVIVKDISIVSLCEHHLLPFSGVVHIAYAPGEWIAGISKFSQAIEVLARRPQIQERLTAQIADVIWDTLAPRGVSIVMECVHTCMSVRGPTNRASSVKTLATRGAFIGSHEGATALSLLN